MTQGFNKALSKVTCKILGHKVVEEMYTTRLGYPTKPLYAVVHQLRCERCGETIKFEMTDPMRRNELLKRGWFIEE